MCESVYQSSYFCLYLSLIWLFASIYDLIATAFSDLWVAGGRGARVKTRLSATDHPSWFGFGRDVLFYITGLPVRFRKLKDHNGGHLRIGDPEVSIRGSRKRLPIRAACGFAQDPSGSDIFIAHSLVSRRHTFLALRYVRYDIFLHRTYPHQWRSWPLAGERPIILLSCRIGLFFVSLSSACECGKDQRYACAVR